MTLLKTLTRTSAAATAAVALALPATAEISGSIEVAGSSTVYPISTFVGQQFTKAYPQASVNIQKIGSGRGIEALLAGNTDAANASRLIKAKELKAAADNGIEIIETLVAYDGLSIVINKGNSWAGELTVEQLKAIFDANSTANTWSDIDPSFPDTPLKRYIPAEGSGTFLYFKEKVVGKTGQLRGTSVGENDFLTVTSVNDDVGAIGFLGYAYYIENKDKINSVAIKNKAGEFVKPSSNSIESGQYNPFSRPLFIYWNVESLNKPEVAALAEFTLDVAPTAAEEVGYVRLPEWVYESMFERLENRTTGSIYYDAELNPKSGTLKDLLGQN
ncbi:MAG: phosphate ABC transporter substrate-binding protein PstS family protein [Planctomycetota bacterium]